MYASTEDKRTPPYSSFPVTITSNGSLDEFPENSANHFKCRLSNTLRLYRDTYLVGLSQILIPKLQAWQSFFSDTDDKKMQIHEISHSAY